MAELSPQDFIVKWSSRFADNTTGQIAEADMREFSQDIADSFGSVQDFQDLNLAWQNDVTYNTEGHTEPNAYAEYQERLYKTKQDGNIGHTPPTEPDGEGIRQDDWWIEISRAESTPIKEWEPGAYGLGLVVVYYNLPDEGDVFLKLNVASRPFQSTDIIAELAAEQWSIIGGSSNGGGGTGVFEPVQDITALKAIDTTSDEDFPDKWAILVEDEGAWYRLDRDSAVAESLPYIVAPTTGTGRWIQDQKAQLDSKVDKVGGDNTFEVSITNPSSWFGSATQMLRSVIQKLHDFIEGQVFKISDIDVSDIDEGQFKIPLVQKVDGEPVVQGSSELIDKLAAQSILLLLSDNANWGNVTGKSGDFIKLEGDNSTGQLGENSQELYDDEGQYFLCISHILDNPGEATWVRNRNRDALKAGVTQDDAVISELEDETNWNTTTNIKIISVRSKVGSWHKSEPEGYLYHCYKETGTPPNQWYWYRSGLPATESMQVLNTGNYTGLVTALAGHDWSTGAYDPSGLAGEKGTQGQEYYDAINRKLYKCIWDGVKLIWEQIQLVTA